MQSATFEVHGTNYRIDCSRIKVPDMEKEADRISAFVSERGGSCRDFRSSRHQKHDWEGYYNGLSFRGEYFLDGIIIGLTGTTLRESRYFVNPMRRNLDLRNGVLLSDMDSYQDYALDRENGMVEQVPLLSDAGVLSMTLEGAVRHLDMDRPEFYSVTGLPGDWRPALRLLTHEQYREEKERQEVRMALLSKKKWGGLTKKRAIERFPEAAEKYMDVFDEVWRRKR